MRYGHQYGTQEEVKAQHHIHTHVRKSMVFVKHQIEVHGVPHNAASLCRNCMNEEIRDRHGSWRFIEKQTKVLMFQCAAPC